MKAFEKSKNRKGQFTRKEALQCRPVKNVDVHEDYLESGEVVLSYPQQIRPWIASLAQLLGKTTDPKQMPAKKLQLDSLGTAVWTMINGKRSVKRLADQLAHQYQLHPQEAEMAVTRFLYDLGKRGVIGLK